MHLRIEKEKLTVLFASLITLILMTQLVAATAWTADSANDGPSTVVLQLSSDYDTEWATNDLLDRLGEFISDDLFFRDRIKVVKTANPRDVHRYSGSFGVYMSHGEPLGIVSGNYLTSWRTMAEVVTESDAPLHLFAACSSRNIIKYGDESNGKKLYTVPGARPAEVTNVEIASTIMLASGIDSDEVQQYRKTELSKAKQMVQSETSVHIMDFDQVILDEIRYIDEHYNDTYTDTEKVIRSTEEETYSGYDGFTDLPLELKSAIVDYYRSYWYYDGTNLMPELRTLLALGITYTKNYYQEAWWVVDDSEPEPPPDDDPEPPPPDDPYPSPDPGDPVLYSTTYINTATATDGHWEYGPLTFSGGTYEGNVQFSSDGSLYTTVDVHVVASGDSIYEVDSISLNQTTAGGVYVQKQKADGVWQEPVTGRNPYRTGGLWTDPCVKADYEYDSSWPTYPSSIYYEDPGSISSNGEYITITGIPTGSEWHGPSFVRTLPAYFTVGDLGSLSANLSLYQHGNEERMTKTMVALYDTNKKLVAAVMISDSHAGSTRAYFTALYRLADGTMESLSSDPSYDDIVFGVPQIRFDPQTGVIADVPGKTERPLFLHSELNPDRLIKYLVIQSYRRKSWVETDERIYNIRLIYAGSEYTVFHDNCNDVDAFISTPSFPYGSRADGVLESPSGQSYMTWDSIEGGGSGWQGPMYVHTLDRPFRLYQLSEFSVVGQLLQSSYTMGKTYVALFDENKQKVALILWGDSWVGIEKGYFKVYFYPQDSSGNSQSSGYIYSSFTKTGKLWWGEFDGAPQGAIYSSIDGQGSSYPRANCDNASRVIKYVGILGYRYKSYNLVDMRIHDINVVADLNAENPNAPEPGEPVEYDGTIQGYEPDSEAISFVDLLADSANANTESWWTGPWPVLHTRTLGVLSSGASYSYEISTDILGSSQLEGMTIDTPQDDSMEDITIQGMVDQGITEFLKEAFPLELALAYAAQVIMLAMDILLHKMTSLPTIDNLALLAILLALYTEAMFLSLYAIWEGIINHRIHTAAAFGALFGLVITLMGEGYFAWANMGSIWAKWWRCRGLWWGTGFRAKFYCILSVLILFVKAFFLGIIFSMMIRCWELWIIGW
ncbi:MAG: hypothetical protein ACOC38_07755 [Promethearchaeia archaeon]